MCCSLLSSRGFFGCRYRNTAALSLATYDHLKTLSLRELWDPACRAFMAAFRSTNTSTAAEVVLEGVAQLASLAVARNIRHGVDYVLSMLCRMTSLFPDASASSSGSRSHLGDTSRRLHYSTTSSPGSGACPPRFTELVRFGNRFRQQMAVVAVFELVRRHGNHADLGWRWVLHVVMRLYVRVVGCVLLCAWLAWGLASLSFIHSFIHSFIRLCCSFALFVRFVRSFCFPGTG